MRSKTISAIVLGAAVAVAVLCSSASAEIIDSAVTWDTRTAILDREDGFVEIIAGGHLTANARVDHDGGVDPAGRVILTGGDFTSTVDYKLPDNATGNPAFMGIYDGTFTANQIESFGLDRDATIEIGLAGTMIVESGYLADYSGQSDVERRYNPAVLIDTGALYASTGLTLNVQDLGGGGVQITSTVETGIKMLAITGDQDVDNKSRVYLVNQGSAEVQELAQLTQVPEGERIAWNPADGLLYHFSGAESWTNDPNRPPGYRDHQYMEKYNMDDGTITPIFNANPPPADPAPNDFPVFGLPAPRPGWVLPDPRRTIDQQDNQWKEDIGFGRTEDEYHALRDLAWSQAEGLWYGSDELGLFKMTPEGESIFVGRPEDDPNTTSVNESNSLKAMTLIRDFENGTQTMIVGMRKDIGIYDIDMETAEVSNRRELTLVDENGTVPLQDNESILALAQDPATGTVYGITRNPDDAFRRKLITLDVETAVGTVIGELVAADLDGDFSSLDFSEWIIGDVNGDGAVNGLDVDPFVDVLLNGSDERLKLLTADINGDNVVNGLDVDPFVALVVGAGTAAVPEPSTLVLAGLALLGLVWYRRRS